MGLEKDLDIAIIGGGLAGSLLAWRTHVSRPELRLGLYERNQTLGGRHTWSFHADDVETSWIDELVSASWSRQEVRFPNTDRRAEATVRQMPMGYRTILSSDFHQKLAPRLENVLHLGADVRDVDQGGLTLGDGSRVTARIVIDTRGRFASGPIGFQKFRGLFLRMANGHSLTHPILMDATVPQRDGYRFFYVLPLSDREALIEDTYYSDGPELPERAANVAEILAYGRRLGLSGIELGDVEEGCLPLPGYGAEAPCPTPGVAWAGVQGGLYHPTTGYSLPEAVRCADLVADLLVSRREVEIVPAIRAHAVRVWEDGVFFRRLNNMLFQAASPAARVGIFAQFYRRNEHLISRFYRGRLGALDRIRLLIGRPPVPVALGLRAFTTPWQALHES